MVSHSGAWAVVSVVRTHIGRHVEKQSSEEGAKVQLTICTASLHTHTSCLDKAARDRLTLYLTKHSTHKVSRAVHHRPPTTDEASASSSHASRSRLRRTPPADHVDGGALNRPFLLSFDHLPHQCTISSIIGNRDYITAAILHGRQLRPCLQYSLARIDFSA